MCLCVCVCVGERERERERERETSEPQAWVERVPGLSQASSAALSSAPLPRWLETSVEPGGEKQ